MRETVESIVVAFVLAFLFRTFEAEAFVIPTGSMAPTLFGRHKDLECEQCRFRFQIGASDELDDAGFLRPGRRVRSARCPNCRYENDVTNLPVFKGDRILVNKFPYELGLPDRWDVVVFKYPEGPATNYIKRLVGLPNESIKIFRGDVYRRTGPGEDVEILRKQDPSKQRALQIMVYDYNFPEQPLIDAGWPRRWAGMDYGSEDTGIGGWNDAETGWRPDDRRHAFDLSLADSRQRQWLRYRHIVPDPTVWRMLEEGKELRVPQPSRILDYCGYNTYTHQKPEFPYDYGSNWVGDLTINCQIDIREIGENAELLLELVEGPRWYRCRFDLTQQQVELCYIDRLLSREPANEQNEAEMEQVLATADAPINGTGTYSISFANVDNRLSVWVNNRLIPFEGRGEYDPPALLDDTEQDLVPVGIAVRGIDGSVSDLKLQRDIYYRAEFADPQFAFDEDPLTREDHSDLLSDTGWLELSEDEFLVLGDNSPRSKDSRLWGNTRRAERRHAVPASALIGKAFYIYWPHGIPFLNNGQGYPMTYHSDGQKKTDYANFRAPFYPQFGRMKRIR